MARKHEAEELLRTGLDASAIAVEMGISFASVVQYLCTRVGERALRHSDIYFAIPKDKREALQRVLEATDRGAKVSLQEFAVDLTWEDVHLFRSLRDRRIFAGDMYEYISETEIALHNLVSTTLVASFGGEEAGWWRQGVSAEIREKCAGRREWDDEPNDSMFSYADLIDLSKVINRNWSHFRDVLPKDYSSDRRRVERDLHRLNKLRNTVMHPVKGRKWTEDDFLFVRHLQQMFKSTEPEQPQPKPH